MDVKVFLPFKNLENKILIIFLKLDKILKRVNVLSNSLNEKTLFYGKKIWSLSLK